MRREAAARAAGPARRFEAMVLVAVEDPPLAAGQVRRLLGALARRLRAPHTSVAVVLGDDARLRALNRRFRGRDRPTDVLSFPSGEGGHLGDIAISVEAARRQARRRGHGAAAEIRMLIIHGFLHLLGYDHEADDGEMETLETTLRWELAGGRARVG